QSHRPLRREGGRPLARRWSAHHVKRDLPCQACACAAEQDRQPKFRLHSSHKTGAPERPASPPRRHATLGEERPFPTQQNGGSALTCFPLRSEVCPVRLGRK